MSKPNRFNVIIGQGTDGYLISNVIELPVCHTHAKNYDELLKRTKEAISLYLETLQTYIQFSVNEFNKLLK